MRFTKPLLDRRASVALVLASLTLTGGAAASCASDADVGSGAAAADASSEASTPQIADAATDTLTDARDAGAFDGGPLPVVCGSSSSACATSLVTTSGTDANDRSEGFCVRLNDGTVACWGAGNAGQLGRGDDAGIEEYATAARVVGLSDVVTLNHTCAVDKAGASYCWGTGAFLQSDAGATTTARLPVKLPIPAATHVSASSSTTCAVLGSGIQCWGRNVNGQVQEFDYSTYYAVFPPSAVDVPAGGAVRDFVVGTAAFVIREDGTTVSWGANPPLGRVSPSFPDSHPQPMDLRGISNLDVAGDNACAAAGGVGYCWGGVVQEYWNPRSKTDRALPEPVGAPEPVVQIATTRTIVVDDFGSSIVQPQRWCACAATGAVYCWGYNASGQAGDGTKNYAFEPVRVEGLPEPAAEVRTTPDATCALLTNGDVYCWGSDFYGQLGNGKFKVSSLVPQKVVLP